jgi:hypothetical protein
VRGASLGSFAAESATPEAASLVAASLAAVCLVFDSCLTILACSDVTLGIDDVATHS